MAWNRRRWIIALIPGLFFAVTNYLQNAAIVGGFAGAPQAIAVLLMFLAAYGVLALILRVAWMLPPPARRDHHRLDVIALSWQVLYAGAAAAAHLAAIAALTTLVRAPESWSGSFGRYFSEILLTCLPVWGLVYAGSLVALLRIGGTGSGVPAANGSDRLAISESGRTRYVSIADIRFVEARGNYARVVAVGCEALPRESLAALARKLPEAEFVRTHRGAIVRKDQIMGIQRTPTGAYHALLKGDHRVPVSRRRLIQVRQALAPGAAAGTLATN